MRVMLVANPSASAVTARTRVIIQNALSADHDLVVSETSRRGHATRLAQSAAAEGYELVISLGGDGTVNEVANGLARTSTALAVLPGGSTNVFARTLGFDNEPVAATHQLLDAVSRGSIRRVGLGNVNGRFFCFHVGIGLDAAVVEQVEKRGQLKRWLGHPLFLFAAIDTWARRYDRDTPPFRVETADGTSSDSYFAVVLNTDPYTYLGSKPLSLAPGSNMANGLSVVSLRNLGLVSTLRTLVAAFRGQPIGKRTNVFSADDEDSFVLRGYRPFPWQVDGDYLGEISELVIQWEPDVLSLVVL
jgi:diacylglycerol kinase family enzyme